MQPTPLVAETSVPSSTHGDAGIVPVPSQPGVVGAIQVIPPQGQAASTVAGVATQSVVAGTAGTDSPSSTEIEPDRPDVTNGPHLLHAGVSQVETGYQYQRAGGSQRSHGTPITFRVGLTDSLELRVSTDGFVRQTDDGVSASGAGNVQVGAKVRLITDSSGVALLSLLPTVNLPVASESKGLGSGDADYTVALLAGADVGRASHVDANYEVGAIGVGGGQPHFVQHMVSVSASRNVTEHFSPYLEAFWLSSVEPHGGHALSLDGGFIRTVKHRFAIDGGLAVGMTSAAPDLGVFGGFSAILGDPSRRHHAVDRERHLAALHPAPAR